MSLPRLNLRRLFAALRITAGMSLLYYHVVIIAPRFADLFGVASMVDPGRFTLYLPSPLFWLWDTLPVLRLLHGLLIASLLLFTVGFYARAAQAVALVLAVSFHHANPFIIHEPQQLGLLLLWVLLWVPIEGAWVVRPTSAHSDRASDPYLRACAVALLAYLSTYYAFAGLKKLPDPGWLRGHALGDVLDWAPLRRDTALAELFRTSPTLAALGTWGALVFEIGFPVIALTRYRVWLAPLGLVLHLMIDQVLQVGHFWIAMVAWYPLLFAQLNEELNPRPPGPSPSS